MSSGYRKRSGSIQEDGRDPLRDRLAFKGGTALKSWWLRGKQAPIHFYRDKDKQEIDLLIVRDDVIHPLEFKKSASPGRDAVRHFDLLARLDRPVGAGGVVCLAESSLPLVEGVVTIPVGAV